MQVSTGDVHSDVHHTNTPTVHQYNKGTRSVVCQDLASAVAPDLTNNLICSPVTIWHYATHPGTPSNPHAAEGFLPEDQEALTACQAPYRTAKFSREGNTWRAGPLPHISPSCIAEGRRIQENRFSFALSFFLSLSTQFPFAPWGKRGSSCQAGAAAGWPGYPKGMSWDDGMYLFFVPSKYRFRDEGPHSEWPPEARHGEQSQLPAGGPPNPGVRDVDSSLMVILKLSALSVCLSARCRAAVCTKGFILSCDYSVRAAGMI